MTSFKSTFLLQMFFKQQEHMQHLFYTFKDSRVLVFLWPFWLMLIL